MREGKYRRLTVARGLGPRGPLPGATPLRRYRANGQTERFVFPRVMAREEADYIEWP